MDTIRQRNELDLDFHHLQVFDVLMTEHSITKAARVLNLTQPALSRTLARLRLYFGDPLFVRVSMRMEPTPKAIELAEPIKVVLESFRGLRTSHAAFDPATSERTFNFYLLDAGVVNMLPRLLNHLSSKAPRLHVQVIQCDDQHLHLWLESGVIDLAFGSFPSLSAGIRRLPLWAESYASLTRKDHPRIDPNPSFESFVAEKHVLVSAVGTGHEHLYAERLIESHVPPENVVCRVPMFTSAAFISKHSDAIATMPRSLARSMSVDLDLQVVEPPFAFPKIKIAQYWHDRVHRDAGNQWIRNVIRDLFGQSE